MLATSGDRVVLLRRDAAAWVPAILDGDNLLSGGTLPAAVTKVEVAAPPADPLTVTTDGLWVDLRVTPAGATEPDRSHRAPDGHRPAARADEPTPTATASATATASRDRHRHRHPDPDAATPTPPTEPTLAVDGRWCDLPTAAPASLCDHPLGFTFAHGERGYRSVATPATADAKFGTRAISAPVDAGVDADARARDAQRQGGYATLDGEVFTLRDGIGDDGSSTTQAIAFAADGTGFTGGTLAFGAVTRGPYSAPREETVAPLGDAITAAATSPNGDGRVLALSRSGGAMLFTPGDGWRYANTALQGTVAHGRYAPLRAIAWPRPNLLIGGGAAGALATVTADPAAPTNGFEFEPGSRRNGQ